MGGGMTGVEIARVVAELAPLVGLPLQRVVQPDAHTVALRWMRYWVVVSADPRAPRLFRSEQKQAGGSEEPPPFCMLLRKVMTGRRLVAVSQLPGDRVVRLTTDAGTLVAELIGPRATLLLLDPDDLLLGQTRTGRAELILGQPYSPPPPPPHPPRAKPPRFDTSAEVERFFIEALLTRRKEELRRKANRSLKGIRRKITNINKDLQNCGKADTYRKWADLLLAQQATLPKKGADRVEVSDLFGDGAPLTIALDPAKDLFQNADRLYRKQRRLAAGLPHAQRRLSKETEKEQIVISVLDQLSEPKPPFEELGAALASVEGSRVVRRRAAAAAVDRTGARLPYRAFVSADGSAIWIGRGARDNHQLTFRHARGRDLWLHTRDMPGCHGVVRMQPGDPIKHQTLLDAATLVAHLSGIKVDDSVDISYTERKNVRPGSAGRPGQVYISAARTLRITVKRDRLDRLLQRQ